MKFILKGETGHVFGYILTIVYLFFVRMETLPLQLRAANVRPMHCTNSL
jgi:hypothetical protein